MMIHHPAMEWVTSKIGWVEVSNVMGAFGACALRPSSLCGNSGWVRGLHGALPKKFKSANHDTVIYEVFNWKKGV
eukprot:3647947-Pyramimonas_sp.AAC.1